MSQFLEVYLGSELIGKLTLLSGDRSFFSFEESYLDNENRAVLSQSFFSSQGGLMAETKIRQTKLPPFFSNLLPEGHLRSYLASQGGINPNREFKLIELLGNDLPGNIRVKPLHDSHIADDNKGEEQKSSEESLYRFSLAGVQLKFSALVESTGGLTIPVNGIGGDWIVKLPAQNFSHVPENEWSMLHLANEVGITVPETRLIDLQEIKGLPDLGLLTGNKAFAVKRFDRAIDTSRIHIEDFAQVYGVYPNDKYRKANYENIAHMLWILTGEVGIVEYIKRLVFTILIGNGDMHLKNWSLIYPDGKTPQLAPAYDFVSTIPYMPNDKLALNLSGTKDMQTITLSHFSKLAKKADLPEYLIQNTAKEMVERVYGAWSKNKNDYPLPKKLLERIDRHIVTNKIRDNYGSKKITH